MLKTIILQSLIDLNSAQCISMHYKSKTYFKRFLSILTFSSRVGGWGGGGHGGKGFIAFKT